MNFSEIFSQIEQDRPTSATDRVLIIDSLNFFLRCFLVVPVISDNGEHIGGVLGFLRSLGSNIREFNPTKCILVFDGKGGSVRRRKIYPEYKANRGVSKEKVRRQDDLFGSDEEERESLRKQLRRVVEYLSLLPVQIISVDNIEADDTIAYICKQFYDNHKNKIRIVSSDRDFLQLSSEQIEIWNPIKKKLYTPKAIEEELGLCSENYLIYRALTGDSSDNIPGIKGLGLKTLLKEFPFQEKKIELDEILEISEKKSKEKKSKKIFTTLLENKPIIERNLELMQLDVVDISGHSKLQILDKMNTIQPHKLDRVKFRRLLAEDHLNVSFKDPDSWLLTTFNGLNQWL